MSEIEYLLRVTQGWNTILLLPITEAEYTEIVRLCAQLLRARVEKLEQKHEAPLKKGRGNMGTTNE